VYETLKYADRMQRMIVCTCVSMQMHYSLETGS